MFRGESGRDNSERMNARGRSSSRGIKRDVEDGTWGDKVRAREKHVTARYVVCGRATWCGVSSWRRGQIGLSDRTFESYGAGIRAREREVKTKPDQTRERTTDHGEPVAAS